MSAIFYKNLPYGAGGSNVEANPSGSATGDLTKVGIDGTVYDVTDADAVHSADKGVANGVASLDATGRVPSAQLPSYVDDVLEYASKSAFPATGESGKIYIALDTNKTYRWSGSAYVEISESLALGTTHGTAAYGDDAVSTAEPSFSEASTRANLAGSGEKLSVILGKIKKWFTDLKDLAFIGKDGASSTKYLRGDGTWQNFPSIPAAQVQSDWNQTDSAQVDFIKNKPDIDLEGSKTATGNPITLTDASESYAEELEVTLEPIQSGSGTPSPSNIRPITGYTDVNVGSVGHNLWDEVWESGYYDASGNPVSSTSNFRAKNYIPVEPNTTYYFKTGTAGQGRLCFYDKSKQFISRSDLFNGNTVLTIPSNCYFVRFHFDGASPNNVSFNYPSTFTTYEPYTSSTTHTNLGRTVYGGKLNVRTGVLTVDRAKTVLTGSESSWTDYNSSYHGFRVTISDMKLDGIPKEQLKSNMFVGSTGRGSVSDTTPWLMNSYGSVSDVKYVWFSNTGYTDVTTWKQFVASNNIELTYPITPQTYQLTPQELKLLKEQNTITTNGTTISLKYQPDNVIGEAIGVSEEYTDRAIAKDRDEWLTVKDSSNVISVFHNITITGAVSWTRTLISKLSDYRFMYIEVTNTDYNFLALNEIVLVDTLLSGIYYNKQFSIYVDDGNITVYLHGSGQIVIGASVPSSVNSVKVSIKLIA